MGRRRRSLSDILWTDVRRLFRRAASDWQANSLARGATMVVMVASALAVSFTVVHGAFVLLSGKFNILGEVELVAGAVFGPLMLVAGWMNWQLYHRGYELREEPVDTLFPPSGHGKWQDLYAQEDDYPSDPSAVLRYADEFFYNALVNPRSVFSRISEFVEPGRKMLDCKVNYEVCPPPRRGVRMFGINDLSVNQAVEVVSCFLTVPVSFQKRGDLTIKLNVSNTHGNDLPTVKQSEVSEHIIALVENYEFGSRKKLKGYLPWVSGTRYDLECYLNNMQANENCEAPEKTFRLMQELAASDEDVRFSEHMLYMLSGLRDVIPVCVSLHVAALKDLATSSTCADAFPPRVFGLYLEQKCETERKPANVFPNPRGRRRLELLNRLIGRFGKRTDTVYYNLARAGRSTSYHLYLEGPEGTYYARGSLLKDNPCDRRTIHAEYVEMQKRYGQRHAHIYIRNGHLMSNASFMFRYKKAPLDTYHIMFVAAFLCLAVLVVSAITSVSSAHDGFANLSVPAMILAVATAAGPWIYNRTSDGKGDSLGVEVSAVVLTICSAMAIILFFITARANFVSGEAIILWSLLVAIMVINTAFVGYVALLHSSLYRYLVDKVVEGGPRAGMAPQGPRAVEVDGGMRLDTPQGRIARNPYSLWTEALRACRESHDFKYERTGLR